MLMHCIVKKNIEKYPWVFFFLRHKTRSATSHIIGKIQNRIISWEGKKKSTTLCSLIKWDALVPGKLINVVTNALE